MARKTFEIEEIKVIKHKIPVTEHTLPKTLRKFDEKLFDEFLDIPGETKKAYTEEGELIRTALRTVASIPVNPA